MVLVNTFFRQPTHFWLKPEIDAAIQLALGESQIVKDIQTYLEDNGVKVQNNFKNNRV